MRNFVIYLQIIAGILMIITILLQQRGTGLSGVFGGGGDVFRTKRGLEKILFWATIVLAAVFLGSGILMLYIK